jgi:hypothetical protein
MEQHFTAWLTVDPTMVLNTNCDVLVLEDEWTGSDWTTRPGASESFKAETSVPAEVRGDHDATQAEAENLLSEAGWTTAGEWEQIDSGYVISVERT